MRAQPLIVRDLEAAAAMTAATETVACCQPSQQLINLHVLESKSLIDQSHSSKSATLGSLSSSVMVAPWDRILNWLHYSKSFWLFESQLFPPQWDGFITNSLCLSLTLDEFYVQLGDRELILQCATQLFYATTDCQALVQFHDTTTIPVLFGF